MGTFAVAWCFYLTCAGTWVILQCKTFLLYLHLMIFSAPILEKKTLQTLSIPQWFVDAPGMFRGGNGGCGFLVAKGWLGGFRCFSFDVKRFTLWAAQAKTKCFQEGIVCNRTAVTRIAWVPSQERQISCACTPKRAKSHISLQNLLFLVFAVDIPKARLDSAHLFECLS